jgi:hypothetical protein
MQGIREAEGACGRSGRRKSWLYGRRGGCLCCCLGQQAGREGLEAFKSSIFCVLQQQYTLWDGQQSQAVRLAL